MRVPKFRPAILSLLAILIGLVAVAACSGGSHGSEPCCSATGAVAQPTAFVSATPSLMAQPIVFPADPLACLGFDSANGLTLPSGYKAVGSAVPVTAGRYDVKISRAGLGQQVYVRIFDHATPETTLALGSLPADTAYGNGPADVFHVAPIFVDPAQPLTVGESTLELIVWCDALKNDLAGSLTLADVRAAVPPETAAGFSPTSANLADLRTRIAKIRTSLDDVVAYPEIAQVLGPTGDYVALASNFRNLRIGAEQFVDECRDGSPPDGTARIKCNGNEGEAEFYRAWKMAHFAAEASVDYARPFRDHLLCWGEHVSDQFGPTSEAADAKSFQLLRRSAMMKFEATDQAIHAAATTNLGLSLSTLIAVETILDGTVRPRLLMATSAAEIAGVWSSAGTAILTTLANDPAANGPINDTQCSPPFPTQYTDGLGRAQATVNGFSTLAYTDKIQQLYGTPAAAAGLEATFTAPLDTCASSLAHDPVKIDGWQEIMFFLSLDATTPP